MDKERDRRNRNLIIIGIVLISGVVIIELVRQKKMLTLKEETARVRKLAAETEAAAAREQMVGLKRLLQEKSHLIEQLRNSNSGNSEATVRLLEELSRQAILTEEDWNGFRNNFEKIHPGFFLRLRQTVPEISMAEQRMAALVLLNMNVKEMAALLGISPDSVRKTRLRLRQRLQLDSQDDLLVYLSKIGVANT